MQLEQGEIPVHLVEMVPQEQMEQPAHPERQAHKEPKAPKELMVKQVILDNKVSKEHLDLKEPPDLKETLEPRDLPVSMVRQALLDQRALREIVVPRDTKVFVDLQEIREPMELGDPQDLLAPGVTRAHPVTLE